MTRFTTAGLALALLVTGCDAGDASPPTVPPAVSVAEAQGSGGDLVAVRGYLFVAPDGTVTIADLIAESFPPQPGGATLDVENLDLGPFDLSSEGDVQWTDDPVEIVGTVDGGTLTATAQG